MIAISALLISAGFLILVGVAVLHSRSRNRPVKPAGLLRSPGPIMAAAIAESPTRALPVVGAHRGPVGAISNGPRLRDR